METRTVEQVESWSTRSVADGYAGLRELSDGEFSGVVRGSGAWLFMLNGRIVGVFEGTLDDFEDADATAYAAPHPSLPLLFSMQEQGGDTRAKYYTNDTPLSEVDSTLTEGKFTGFVELSENVLSGDYYVAYYGGRSLSVAFVGASEQVVTGDDAFERAADEVGIYEVTDVDVQITDVPEPEGDDSPDASSGGAPGSGATGGGASGGGAAGGGASGGGASSGTATGGAASGGTSEDTDAGSEAGTSSTAGTTSGSTAGATSGSTAGADADSGTKASLDASSTAGADATGTDASARSTRSSEGRASGSDQPDGETSPGSSPSASRPSGDDPDATGQRPDAGAAGTSRPDPGTTESPNAGATDVADVDSTASETSAADTSTETETSTSEVGRTAESGRTTDAARETTADRTASTRDAAGASADASTNRPASGEATSRTDVRDAGAAGEANASDPDTKGNGSATGTGSSAVGGETEWRETTTIPSLDPDLSDGLDETPSDSQAGATAAGTDRSGASESGETDRSRSGRRPTEGRQSGTPSKGAAGASAGGSSASDSASDSGSGGSSDAEARIRTLRKQLEQRKQQVEKLKERLSTLESERNEYERERDALRQEVERLEAKLERPSSADGSEVGRRLSEAEAFDGTNLFVRYESKGEATLDEAANGQVDQNDVNANLRLEHHTQFEAGEASVDGEPFEAFLTDSFEYEFASWVVEELLYEIRDTGQRNALKELYEAIPKIDRVDLHGAVSAGDDREDTRQESFDVIMRDRMGEPLVVADLNGSRDPTTGEMMGSLVDAASGVSQAHDELSGAFQVTESFFEPEALETAEAATSGGLLSREKRASFVKLSRKRGYHLCLVESRGSDFHLNVPEL